MTEEMTRAGMEAEARRRYREAAERGKRNHERWLIAIYALVILGGTALLIAFAATKRAERDSRAEMNHANYEMVASGAVTGGGAR